MGGGSYTGLSRGLEETLLEPCAFVGGNMYTLIRLGIRLKWLTMGKYLLHCQDALSWFLYEN